MTVLNNNKILQTTVDYQIQEQKGAVAVDLLSATFDVDDAEPVPANFTYGEPLFLGPNMGVIHAPATATLANLLGFIKYQNSGVIDAGGYSDSLYQDMPCLKQGTIYIPCTGTMDLDSVVYLIVDPTVTGYQKVVNGSVAGSINISSLAKVLKKSANDVVLLDLNIL